MTEEAYVAIDDATLQQIVGFHGHMCPGLAMGVLASNIALDEIGPHAADEEVVAVTETDMCAVDAVQFLTGCTFGKGNLIHNDWGKNAFTFYRRSDGKAIRVVAKPDVLEQDPERADLFTKIRSGEASEAEQARFGQLQKARSEEVLAMNPEELYSVERFMGAPPPRARIHATIACENCGEGVMATRLTEHEGRNLCTPCFDALGADASSGREGRPNLLDS